MSNPIGRSTYLSYHYLSCNDSIYWPI